MLKLFEFKDWSRNTKIIKKKQPPGIFYKKGALKNFAIFKGKHLRRSPFFIKFHEDLEACNFIKKKLRHRCFPVNIAKFFRTPILKNICERLVLTKEIQLYIIIIQYDHMLQQACFLLSD